MRVPVPVFTWKVSRFYLSLGRERKNHHNGSVGTKDKDICSSKEYPVLGFMQQTLLLPLNQMLVNAVDCSPCNTSQELETLHQDDTTAIVHSWGVNCLPHG